jgi:hypothetical protein
MTAAWPWLVMAGLGAFHGLNPAMGWLFAVALGLHRDSERVVLLPIAAGHALSVAAVAALLVVAGYFVDPTVVRIGSGGVLILWAAYHWRFGHKHRAGYGLTIGMLGLFVWSFLMATAHGAGLMLWPVLMPLCFGPGMTGTFQPFLTALAGVGVHTAAMLATIAAVALVVYHWVGLAFLRHAWINVDLVWAIALGVTGTVMILV